NMFGPAQDYVYEENGNIVVFKWAADGPWDYYRKSGTTPIAVDDALTGVIWSLSTLNGESLVPATYISAEFDEEGRMGGSAGCNSYSAPYQADGVNIEIGIGPMTMMMCPDPVVVQESAYMGALEAAATYEATEESLTLFDSTGQAVATYEVENQGLSGTAWEVISYNNGRGGVQSVALDTEITANFGEDGQVTGSAGCNDYFAPYQTGGPKITIGPGGVTQKFCAEPEGIMQQESDYLAALESVAIYRIDGLNMNMRTAEGSTALNLRRVSDMGAQTTAQPSEVDIVGTTWYWRAFQDTAEVNDFSVKDPASYSLTLQPDGGAAIQADCNQVLWQYTLEGSSLSFNTLGPSTLAFCGEDSLDGQYLSMLGNVATYVVDDAGDLHLNLFADAGNMVFSREATSGLTLSPDQITIDTQGLPYSWQAVLVPEQPYDQSLPPGPTGLPAHIEILFGAASPADVNPGDPIMYIIPADTYRRMWDDAGNEAVTRTMADIQQLNFVLPLPGPTSGYPALPFEQVTGVNDLTVQVAKSVSQAELNTTSATQDGYRFVGRWAQDANPVMNRNLRYTYQGFTNDGVYFVSLWWPEATSALSDDPGSFSEEELSEFYADPTAAINASAEALNALSADQWDPDLSVLDALVASLQIEGMPASGLVDKNWLWVEGPAQPGSSEIVRIDNPTKYQVIYNADGTMNFIADCNSGSMSYELRNAGMTGGMLAQPGPTTLAACPPDSYSDAFIASLQASQDYRVWAGGQAMELVLPAGGGVLRFRDADAPAPTSATVSGYITNEDGLPIPDGSTVSVQLQDTSRADAPAQVVAEQLIYDASQFPISYRVVYDPSDIEANHSYTMRARITGPGGLLLFINDTSIPVITRGNPADNIEIPVIETASSSAGSASVSGLVTYAGGGSLPAGATVTIQIRDTSLADAPATVVGEQVMSDGGDFPIAYEVKYNPNLVIENHSYTMSCRITNAAGSLIFINDTAIPVITRGFPSEDVEILVIQVGG
ncbi:MAG: META domain-containing protein, partial [Candidatus Promineifilaceae bacterium]